MHLTFFFKCIESFVRRNHVSFFKTLAKKSYNKKGTNSSSLHKQLYKNVHYFTTCSSELITEPAKTELQLQLTKVAHWRSTNNLHNNSTDPSETTRSSTNHKLASETQTTKVPAFLKQSPYVVVELWHEL